MSVEALDRALRASERALSLARAHAWDSLAEALTARDDALHALPPETSHLTQVLTHLQFENEQIVELACAAREEIGRELHQHRATHRAVNAYLSMTQP